uniref:Uncharacterized protein n=1 Tax=Aegilops tauschii TaxID=37682 RepID=M8C7K7_AEGTA
MGRPPAAVMKADCPGGGAQVILVGWPRIKLPFCFHIWNRSSPPAATSLGRSPSPDSTAEDCPARLARDAEA